MPRYQYQCRDCSSGFEQDLPVEKSSQTQACPHCHSTNTRKIFSANFLSGGSKAEEFSAVPSCAGGMCPGAAGVMPHGCPGGMCGM